jgi:DNA helicase-2/ATP-dependent DNA helicase PcrA
VPDIEQVLRRELTPAQYAAATDPASEIQALAGAGSGKSKTLAFRAARLLAEGEDPKGLVVFTFTDKAADSVKLRVSQALVATGLEPTLVGAMYVGTIHGYCQRLLGEMDARHRQFDVLDDNRLVMYLMSRYGDPRYGGLGLADLRAAHPTAAGRPARYFDTITEVANAWKLVNEELLDLADVVANDPVIGRVLVRLAARLDQDQFYDFSLMVRRVVDALARGADPVERALGSLRHLMVDEYQDVNPVQERLICLMHDRSQTLFVVGDDDQAIYGWRGADVGNILTFGRRHPAAGEHSLTHNFRSTRAIVQAADGFAAAELGAARLDKRPTADDPPGPRDFRVLWFHDRAEEACWVAHLVEALLGTEYVERDGTVRGLTPADFAVLMRSTRGDEQDGSQRHSAFTSALDELGIPYSLEAGGGLFDRPQVAALREALGLLRDRSPSRAQVRDLFDRVLLACFPNADFDRLVAVFSDWGRRIHWPPGASRQRLYPQRLLHELLAALGLPQTRFDEGTMRDLGVFSQILQDAETVYVSIDSRDRFAALLNFLDNVAEKGYDTSSNELLRRPDAVTVATVHKAKGLEFPVVFVVDVEAGRFPTPMRGYQGWLPRAVVGAALARPAYQSSPAEEARLFYTAITRAERYLYVTGCARLPGGRNTRRPSPFAARLVHPEIDHDPAGLPAGLRVAPPGRRVDETVVPTTYSQIRYYLRCPHDYRLRTVFGFSPPIEEMFGFGQTVHAAVGKLHERYRRCAPTQPEAEAVAREVFHLKHVPPSRDPVNRPGGYEQARDASARIVRDYARDYGVDFAHERQVEVAFEIPIAQAVVSGTIDLLLRYDDRGVVVDASVVDFKTMEGGADPLANRDLDWGELALQVQLYARAAREVLGELARTGAVHLLKDGQRVWVPVDDAAVADAVAVVEWAVDRVIASDFPMRPHADKCATCDFQLICARRREEFRTGDRPPMLQLPGGPEQVRAFGQVGEGRQGRGR